MCSSLSCPGLWYCPPTPADLDEPPQMDATDLLVFGQIPTLTQALGILEEEERALGLRLKALRLEPSPFYVEDRYIADEVSAAIEREREIQKITRELVRVYANQRRIRMAIPGEAA
jgi:hypothetical protein